METISGEVAAVRKDGKGLCIDDVWYSSWDKLKVERGDNVVFNYVTKGTFNNIKGAVRISTSAPAAGKAGPRPNNLLGVELGHASNLAQRMLELHYTNSQVDVESKEYLKHFASQTLKVYEVMQNIRQAIANKDAKVEEKKEVPSDNPHLTAPAKSDDLDLF